MINAKYPMAENQTEHRPPLAMFRRAGALLFISGHGAVNASGEFLGDNFESQFHYTMEQLRGTLQEADADFADVISVRSYVQNPADLPLYNQLYRQYFSEPFPARTTIVNCLPPGLLFEIECVAHHEE